MKACNRIFFYGIPLVLCLLGFNSYAQDTTIGKEKTKPEQTAILKNINVSEDKGVTKIEIISDSPLIFTKYSITEPPRAIIDLPSTEAGTLKAPQINDSKIVKNIELSKNNLESAFRTRIIINLKKNAEINVSQDKANKGRIVVSICENEKAIKTASYVNIEPPKQKPVLFSQNPNVIGQKNVNNEIISDQTVKNAPSADKKTATVADANSKTAMPVDQKEIIDTSDKSGSGSVKADKLTISALNITGEGIEIIADSSVKNYKSFRMSKPQRLIVDILDAKTSIKGTAVPINRFGLGKARLGTHPNSVRIVFDAPGKTFPKYEFESSEKGLIVSFVGSTKDKKSSDAEKVASEPANVQKATEEKKQEKLSIESIDFKEVDGYSRVIIKANDTLDIGKPVRTSKGILLTVKNCLLPKKLQRPFNTKAFEGSVLSITPYQVRTSGGYDTKILIKLRNDAPYELKPEGSIVTVEVKNEEMREAVPQVSSVHKLPKVTSRKAPGTESKEAAGTQITPGKKVYTGQRVTLEFADADIRKIFQLIAEVSNLNFLLGDDVTGTISIKLVNVPWDQALDVILETKGLGMKREGNIVVIRPIGKIQTLAEEQQAEKKARERAMDLKTKVFDVNYAAVSDIVSQFNSIKSERGIIVQDARTNRVIVTDIEPAIEKMTFLLKNLDLPEKQVMIEARIVEATSTAIQDIGIQWGIHSTGIEDLNINNLDAGFGGLLSAGEAAATGTFGPGAASSITFGGIIKNGTLDLKLSALASAQLIKVISTPKVLTLNNKAAKITQGQQIPYQTVSAEGTQTQFVQAALSLEVTPHITADGSISMKIKASNDSAGTGSPPPINTKEATTELLIKNGETTVIGGIYQDSDTEDEQGVPFLKDIPLLGWLFKSKDKTKIKTELLIFITPRVVS
ncbi:MAG TPA: type IV pilus secretin PilQ [Geobacteraceae bacterium]|nr:type IV pilus secretin PilQ [Geobacteraceae bacterium]